MPPKRAAGTQVPPGVNRRATKRPRSNAVPLRVQVKRRLDEQYLKIKEAIHSLQQLVEPNLLPISRHWRSIDEDARISILEEAWPDIGDLDPECPQYKLPALDLKNLSEDPEVLFLLLLYRGAKTYTSFQHQDLQSTVSGWERPIETHYNINLKVNVACLPPDHVGRIEFNPWGPLLPCNRISCPAEHDPPEDTYTFHEALVIGDVQEGLYMFLEAVCQKLVEKLAALPAPHGANALPAPRQIFATSAMLSSHKLCRKLYFQITGDTLPPFLNSMRHFYKEGLPVRGAPKIDWDAGHININTAIICQYHNNGNPVPFPLGYQRRGLHGCTTLLVVSRKAVYATHWWENVSFAPDGDEREKKRGGILETDAEVFTRTVLNPLRKGMTKNGVLHHPELTASIGDPYVRAYLVRPQRCSDGTLHRYRTQWDKIRVTVAELVPELQDMSRWAEIVYRPLNKGDRKLRTGWHGRILFRYHPPSEERVWHTAKLWVENEPLPYHDDIWR